MIRLRGYNKGSGVEQVQLLQGNLGLLVDLTGVAANGVGQVPDGFGRTGHHCGQLSAWAMAFRGIQDNPLPLIEENCYAYHTRGWNALIHHR